MLALYFSYSRSLDKPENALRFDGIRTPIGPAQPPKRGAVHPEIVAALLELPRPANAGGDLLLGTANRSEVVRISSVPVEPDLRLQTDLLERRVLPTEIQAGSKRPVQHAFPLPLHRRIVYPVGRRDCNGEQVEAGVERVEPSFGR